VNISQPKLRSEKFDDDDDDDNNNNNNLLDQKSIWHESSLYEFCPQHLVYIIKIK